MRCPSGQSASAGATLPPSSVIACQVRLIGTPQRSVSHSGWAATRRRTATCITRTRIAVARPVEPGVNSAPGSETSIQNRTVSKNRRRALSPA